MAKVTIKERTFPRGGQKPKSKHKKAVDFGLFKAKNLKKTKVKQNKHPQKSKATSSLKISNAAAVRDLSKNDIQPGLLVLGCVSKISDKSLLLSLPNGFQALVSALNISDPFTSMIEKRAKNIPALADIFNLNDFYPVRILSAKEDNASIYTATINPTEVNNNIARRSMAEGMILSGAIVSLEDHGYVVDLGIKKCTAFLANKQIDDDVKYTPGSVIRCVVFKISQTTVHLSTKRSDLSLAKASPEWPLHSVLPGYRFQATVKSVLKNGLELSLRETESAFKGYIYVDHLTKLFDKPSNYAVGTSLDCILLYVLPLVNYLFFKTEEQERTESNLENGSILSAKVLKSTKKGLLFKLGEKDNKSKCFVPLTNLDEYEELISGKGNILELYPAGKEIPKIRIIYKALFNRRYVGSMRRNIVEESFFTFSDVKPGMVLKCKIIQFGETYTTVQISPKLRGYIANYNMTDGRSSNISKKFRIGSQVKARVLYVKEEERTLRLTLKSQLVHSKEPILKAYKKAMPGSSYLGTIVHISPHQLLVSFFNEVCGVVRKEHFPVDDYYVGKVVRCYVLTLVKKYLLLSLFSPDMNNLKQGLEYEVAVDYVDARGLHVTVKNESHCKGLIPVEMLSNNSKLSVCFLKQYSIGDELKATLAHFDFKHNPPYIFSTHPTIRQFFKNSPVDSRSLTVGSTIPLFFFPKKFKDLELVPVMKHEANFRFIADYENMTYLEYSVILAKIMEITPEEVIINTDFKVVWDHHYKSSLEHLNSFLEEIKRLRLLLKEKKRKLKYTLGMQIQATSANSLESEPPYSLNISDGVKGQSWFHVAPASKIACRVVWIDYSENVLWLHPIAAKGPFEVTEETRETIRAKVLHVCPDVIVAESCGTHQLVYIPTMRHANDYKTYDFAYQIGEITKVNIFRFKNILLGLDRQIVKKLDRIKAANGGLAENPTSAKTVENHNSDDSIDVECVIEGSGLQPDPVKIEVLSDEETREVSLTNKSVDSDCEVKQENEEGDESIHPLLYSSSESDSEEGGHNEPKLEIGFNWSQTTASALSHSSATVDSSSSSDEDREDKAENKKRKRMSVTERREKAKEAEKRLRLAEDHLMDPSRPPQSADDFDRLVVSRPDDSRLWLQYMAYHLENTEIEKARAVARRALNAISFREELDKLNIWFALLNLEQLYGTAETQRDVFEEALKYNNPYKIHLHQLQMIADNGEAIEAERLANVMVKKYSDVEGIWWEVGGVLMKLGKLDAARSILHRAMAKIPKTKHVTLVTRFAQLENLHGSHERAQTLYEHVLSAFPKRVDVWSAYVDLMVKSNRVDLARNILERATSQTLPSKKKKILFMKFIAFEEQNGTPDQVQRVRQAAAEYTDSISKTVT